MDKYEYAGRAEGVEVSLEPVKTEECTVCIILNQQQLSHEERAILDVTEHSLLDSIDVVQPDFDQLGITLHDPAAIHEIEIGNIE